MAKKAIFFDIDGTLWDNQCFIPNSTKEAISKLHENGHLVFICSGRTRIFIPEGELLDMGFDGILCGCGTHIEYEGNDILYKKLDVELIERTMNELYDMDLPVVMEGKKLLYMDDDMISRDNYGKFLIETMKGKYEPIRNNKDNWEASKFSVVLGGRDYSRLKDKFANEYTFLEHLGHVVELVPNGYSKATGIKFVCDKLGIEWEDTYAFGDSANDIEMIDYVAHGVVMGNGTDEAKKHADYVTDDLHEDGIYNACKHFELI